MCTFTTLSTFDSNFHVAAIVVATPALALLVPIAVFARTLRHYRALRMYGTAHLTASQKLELEGRYAVLRHAARASDLLILAIVAMLIQSGVVVHLYKPIPGLGMC